ncbi:MAG: ribosome recycling factor [Bacteroidales bacterium]|jgi:ribosome recycling factor|nr:ribosome recycling factor [Bacteroidales bacterium]
MTPESKMCIEKHKTQMQHAIEQLEKELVKIRASKASPQMLQGVLVDYYGTPTPLDQVASVNTPDPKTINIQPWEKTLLKEIEKTIINSNLGFNPQNTGEIIRISVPPLTEERRKELVKKAKEESEKTKVAVRNIRRNGNEEGKKLEKAKTISEDEVKLLEKEMQDLTNKFIENIDKILATKEKDILTI